MLLASENVSAELHVDRIPLLEGAMECVRAGYIPGGLIANREFAECTVKYEGKISDELKTLLFDPQTSGGLLIAVAEERAEELQTALQSAGVPAVSIGQILAHSKPLIRIKN
jgi:selenide,water dikinase